MGNPYGRNDQIPCRRQRGRSVPAMNCLNKDMPTDACIHRNLQYAIRSSCWGAIPQVMLRDSSLIIIFASLIGAGEMVSVLSTGLLDLSLCVLMLPLAALSDRIGVKRQILMAVGISVAALLLVAAAPWAGPLAGGVMMTALLVFAICLSAYTAAWFPLLERVVPVTERGLFFGRMRFSWQLVATVFVFASSWFVGRFATVGRLQVIITLAALGSLGRAYYIARIELDPRPPAFSRMRTALAEVLNNRALCGFGVYLFFLYLAVNATTPVIFVFARNHLLLEDRLVILLSAVSMLGLIAGFPLGGRLVHRYGAKGILLAAHLGFGALNFALLLVHESGPLAVAGVAAVLAACGLLIAGASIAVSSELLALANPAEKAVSIAFGYSLYAAGLGGSRMLASLLLGSGILAETWQFGGQVFSRYHSLFLAFGCGTILAMILLVQVPGLVRRVERFPSA